MLRLYGKALQRVDGGWLNAFGWSNIGIERYFDEYFARTANLNRIVSASAASRADEIEQLFETVQRAGEAGRDRGGRAQRVLPQRQLPVRDDPRGGLRRAVPKSRHPVILKVSPDEDYRWQARLADEHGCAAITAINTVKGLRLDPETGEPYLKNRYGAISGRAIKPIGLRVVAELRDGGHPAADHRQRRDPRLRRLPRVRLGRRRRRVASGRRSGSSRCRCTRSGRSRGCGSAA